MVRISWTEFQKNVARLHEATLPEPVTITRNGRDRMVLMSVEEYRRLKRLERRAPDSNEITQEDIAAMERGKLRSPPSRHGHELAFDPYGLLTSPEKSTKK